LHACERAVDDATSFEHEARTIEASWRERLAEFELVPQSIYSLAFLSARRRHGQQRL